MPFTTWSEAYLMQAKQDFALAKVVIEWRNSNGNHQMTDTKDALGASVCMLLQMFFEKYSKACYCSWNHDKLPPRNHKTVRLLINYLKKSNNPYYTKATIISGNLKTCYNIMQELEDLQPSNANAKQHEDTHPQLEYPWNASSPSLGDKMICTPALDLPIAKEIDSSSSRILCFIIKFSERLLLDFNMLCSK